MPPAPWQSGAAPIRPAITLVMPRERESLPGVTPAEAKPKYDRAVSAVATIELPKVRGIWGRTRRKKATVKSCAAGKEIVMGVGANASFWSEVNDPKKRPDARPKTSNARAAGTRRLAEKMIRIAPPAMPKRSPTGIS